MTLLLLGLFVTTMLAGVPVAVSMGLSAAVTIFVFDLPITVLAQRSLNALNSTPLLAVPLFILAANLFNQTGVTNHLFDLMRRWVGHYRGGIAQVTILVSLVFSGISGAALADIGAIGSMEMKVMRERGYRDEFAAGITIAGATIGPIFPPSIPIIIYATAASESAVRLLLAGVVPAILIAVLMMTQVAVMARLYDLPRDEAPPERSTAGRQLFLSLPALLAPVILIGGLLSGLFGPTEIAGVAAVYAILIGRFVYRRLDWAAFITAARQTVEATASVLFIVASAALFAWVLTVDRVPVRTTELLLGLSDNPVVLLFIVNVLLLVSGMVLESIAAILIIAPIIVPALTSAGVDPIQLGIVFVLNLMIGLLTPPVGMSLYMVSIIANMKLSAVVRGVLPFLISLLLSLAVVTLVPAVSTWLPGLLMK